MNSSSLGRSRSRCPVSHRSIGLIPASRRFAANAVNHAPARLQMGEWICKKNGGQAPKTCKSEYLEAGRFLIAINGLEILHGRRLILRNQAAPCRGSGRVVAFIRDRKMT